jgi:hypothetical protein
MDEKAQNKRIWNEKKKAIIGNINEAMDSNEETLKIISDTQVKLGEAGKYLTYNQIRLAQMKRILNSEAYVPDNPVNAGSITIMNSLSTNELGSAKYMFSTAGAMRTNADSLVGSTLTSGSLVASMASSTVYLAERMVDTGPIMPLLEELKKPTAHDRLKELAPKLFEIGESLSTKLNGSWETLSDFSKDDRVSQSAHSARDLISDILIKLAPDEKVMKMEWFKPETREGRPSQKQRAKYAILGKNTALSDLDIQPIHDLSDNIRASYQSLTSLAHLRDYGNDLQKMTENLIDEVQIYLLKLLELRAIYFVPIN